MDPLVRKLWFVPVMNNTSYFIIAHWGALCTFCILQNAFRRSWVIWKNGNNMHF